MKRGLPADPNSTCCNLVCVKLSPNMWHGLTKQVLWPMTGSPLVQSYVNALIDFIVRLSLWYLVCFSCLALWRSVWAVWGLYGTVVSWACLPSLVVLDKGLRCSFTFISDHQWPILLGLFTYTPSQSIQSIPLPAHLPHHHLGWGSPDTVEPEWTLV